MTIKVFWQNPYLTELEARVSSIDPAERNRITLEETIFYAFSGCQESDAGTIGGYTVLEAKKVDREIFYYIDPNHNLKVGDNVKIIIDWERRYRLMKLHFAAEIVLELIYQKFQSIENTGAYIAADKARIDFTWPENFSQYLSELQKNAQNIIDSNQEIISAFSDLENERRYWKIKEFSQVPCGGTHLKRTQEIGQIFLKRVNPGKGRERVEITVA